MKSFAATCSAAVALLLLSSAPQRVAAQASVSISYQHFYNELEPYGRWIDYPGYGYVWQPQVGSDFRPYSTNGQWAWTTEFGWTWISLYSWGWAPFHYGRWMIDDLYGWLWVPGNEWAPAWVCWRSGSDYYGWAPLGPETNIDLSLDQYSPPVNYWCFVQRRNVTSPYLGTYCIQAQRNAVLINATTIINNRRRNGAIYSTGPRSNEVENYTHVVVRPAILRESSKPGRLEYRNNELAVYRPVINNDNRRYAPSKFDRYNGKRPNDIAANKEKELPKNRGWQSAATLTNKNKKEPGEKEEVSANNTENNSAASQSRTWQSASTLYNRKNKEVKEQGKVEEQKAVDPGPPDRENYTPPNQSRGWQSATSIYNRKVREVRRREGKKKTTP